MIALALKIALVGGLVHFQSPSGNINCIGGPAFQGSPAFVECLARKATWLSKPRKPASCDLDWDPADDQPREAQGLVGSCRGDIGPLCVYTSDKCSTLGYGRSVTIGPDPLHARRRPASRAGTGLRRARASWIAREHYVLYNR